MLAGSDGLEEPGLCVLTLTEKDSTGAEMHKPKMVLSDEKRALLRLSRYLICMTSLLYSTDQ